MDRINANAVLYGITGGAIGAGIGALSERRVMGIRTQKYEKVCGTWSRNGQASEQLPVPPGGRCVSLLQPAASNELMTMLTYSACTRKGIISGARFGAQLHEREHYPQEYYDYND